jgi:hypothetical protein
VPERAGATVAATIIPHATHLTLRIRIAWLLEGLG